MNYLQSLFFSFKKLLFPKRSTSELDEELQFHLDMSIEQKMAQGMSQQEAEREAKRELGSDLRIRECCRMNWGTRIVDETVQDMRRAARRLWKRPSYSIPVILILGVALGACGTFSDILYQRILRPLPYPDVDEILQIAFSYPREEPHKDLWIAPKLSEAQYIEELEGVFESVGHCWSDGYFLKMGDKTEFMNVLRMTVSVWDVMQVKPSYGRAFTQEDVSTGATDVAVVTHSFASRRFGSATNALGESILLSGKLYRVIGVMGKGDAFPLSRNIAIPFHAATIGRSGKSFGIRALVLCRLNGDGSKEQLLARLPAVLERIKEENESDRRHYERFNIQFKVRRWVDFSRVNYSKLSFHQLVILLSILAFLLFLIASLNWLSVLRTKMIQDMRSTGIRHALGAPKLRLFRSMCMENVLLLTVTLITAFFFSSLLHEGINQWSLFESTPIVQNDLGYWTMLLLITITALMSVPPIFHYLQTRNVQKYLHERQSTSSAQSKSLFTLSIIQTFLCTVLLLVSILLALNIGRILKTDFGFKYDDRLVAAVQIPTWKQELSDAEKLQLLKRLKQGVMNTREFESVSISSCIPQGRMLPGLSSVGIDAGQFPESPPQEYMGSRNRVMFSTVVTDEDFREALGLQLMAGRWFQPSDEFSETLEVVIDQRTARTLFGNENPIGYQFVTNNKKGEIIDQFEIIGLVNDVIYRDNQSKVDISRLGAYLYFAESDNDASWPKDYNIVCKSRGLKVSNFEALRKAIRDVDSDLGLEMKSYREELRSLYETMWMMSKVALAMAVVTVIVAGYGSFSFLYYKTQLMKKEFAIRLTLGSGKRRLLFNHMKFQAIPLGIGMALGMMVVFGLFGQFANHLTDVSRGDMTPYLFVAFGMAGFVALSSLFPLIQIRGLELRELLQSE